MKEKRKMDWKKSNFGKNSKKGAFGKNSLLSIIEYFKIEMILMRLIWVMIQISHSLNIAINTGMFTTAPNIKRLDDYVGVYYEDNIENKLHASKFILELFQDFDNL